ncbi:MAG: helical backbone metal receptor [Myxococcota bacterium]|jgi:ABC-type hemin transport system substrate-binding protein
MADSFEPRWRDAPRIVSLVPSLTEALFALEIGDRVVGVTEWCIHPANRVARLPRVGGTKTPSVSQIVALHPALVIANHEENPERVVAELTDAGIDVWVTYPRTVRDGTVLLRELAELGASPTAVEEVVVPCEKAVERAEREPRERPVRVFCPIWKRPWMSVGGDTYASDLLRLCGGDNVFADRGDRRYPIVEDSDIVAAEPEVILLPDEPYAFGPRDAAELGQLAIPAARNHRIHPIDGTLVSWYGPRIARAIETVQGMLENG